MFVNTKPLLELAFRIGIVFSLFEEENYCVV